jgi:hypothetical protein
MEAVSIQVDPKELFANASIMDVTHLPVSAGERVRLKGHADSYKVVGVKCVTMLHYIVEVPGGGNMIVNAAMAERFVQATEPGTN